jgi:hypothetical protein
MIEKNFESKKMHKLKRKRKDSEKIDKNEMRMKSEQKRQYK